MTGTRRSLRKQIAKDTGLTELDAEKALNAVLQSVTELLGTHGRMELRDFGVFTLRHKPTRTRQNPRTGAKIELPPKTKVMFVPGVNVNQAVKHFK